MLEAFPSLCYNGQEGGEEVRLTAEEWEEFLEESGLNKIFQNLEGLLRAAHNSPENSEKVRVVIPDKMRAMQEVGGVFEPQAQVELRVSDISSHGYVEVCGKELMLDPEDLRKLLEVFKKHRISNMEILPKTDGTVLLTLCVRNVSVSE